MSPQRLTILYVSQMPASPPRFGAQARMHGLMTQLARQHDLSAVMLVDDEFDIEECRRPLAQAAPGAAVAFVASVLAVPVRCPAGPGARALVVTRGCSRR